MDETTGAVPEVPPMPPVSPTPPRTARRRNVAAAIVGALAIAGVSSGTTAWLLSGSDKDAADSKPVAATSAPARPADAPAEAAEATTGTYNDAPTPADFALTLRTTDQQCFGSAGCNITVEPKLSYTSLTSLDPEKTYSITYEIHGDESGPIIETMDLTDQDQLSYQPISLSTSSRSTKVTAEITDVTVSI
ncbi:hypothetical protein AB0E88_23060 [Streptomyces sp. NPDC028635]|uniref:hypothetical protein n=1 Tax=Streptomyces sp. NPDC028635 TaxID=3154800 RepID=UPI0033E448E7